MDEVLLSKILGTGTIIGAFFFAILGLAKNKAVLHMLSWIFFIGGGYFLGNAAHEERIASTTKPDVLSKTETANEEK